MLWGKLTLLMSVLHRSSLRMSQR
jgi:hypothetical protein